jgi:hypothetical protein
MGFQRTSNGFERRFPDSDDVLVIFDRFRSHIETVIRHEARVERCPWEEALSVVCRRLDGNVGWWLTGSTALAVRGVDVQPRDIDLVVEDASRAGECFGDVLIEPVTPMRGWVADWFGRAFERALIEWVAGVHDDVEATGRPEHSPEAARRLEVVEWRGNTILCCSPLDLQLRGLVGRGLEGYASAVHRYLGTQTCAPDE